MGKLGFFRKERGRTTPAELQVEVQCKNLTDNLECSILAQIKNYQKELADVQARISDIEKCCHEIQQLKMFLMSGEMSQVCRSLYPPSYRPLGIIEPNPQETLWEYNTRRLYHAIGNISDIDRLCDELKTIHNKENLLRDLKLQANKISQRITVLKAQLGIQ